jgi:predicted nucleotidyltransferase
MATARELSPEALAGYRAAARRRSQDEQRTLAVRERRAWELARRVAAALRQEFRASRVVVFGSLVNPGCFTPWSEVDIAVWGLRPEDTFRAIGVAMDSDSEIAVHLVDVATCSTALLRVIEDEGAPL